MGALTLERVRGDIEVLARAGLDTATFLAETDESLRRAVPYSGICMATLDPATSLLTGVYKFGSLAGLDSHDHEWSTVEYGGCETDAFTELARSERSATAVSHATGGDTRRSARIRDFMEPYFGYTDELRMVARHGGRTWGGMALLREADGEPFDPSEVAYLESLSGVVAAGLRSGLLVRLGSVPTVPAMGPIVLIVDRDDNVGQVSVGAEELLRDLASAAHSSSATGVGIVGALVAGARRYSAGSASVLPRTRVRLASGRWLVLHASPLSSAGGASGDVVVTIEEARPPEVVPLIVAAFELTARERDVAQLVLQGVDTREIAASLHMSRYTVQDHLKSVFDKAGVRSRRELVSRVYFDQYASHVGDDLAPSGWFAPRSGADTAVAAEATPA